MVQFEQFNASLYPINRFCCKISAKTGFKGLYPLPFVDFSIHWLKLKKYEEWQKTSIIEYAKTDLDVCVVMILM